MSSKQNTPIINPLRALIIRTGFAKGVITELSAMPDNHPWNADYFSFERWCKTIFMDSPKGIYYLVWKVLRRLPSTDPAWRLRKVFWGLLRLLPNAVQYYCMVYRSSLVRNFRSRVGFSKCWKCSFSPPCRQIRDRQTKEVLTHGNHSKDFGMPQDTKCQLFGFQGRKRQLCRVQLLCK